MKDIATAIFAILTSLFMICETETMSALLITKTAALLCGYITFKLYNYDYERD